MNNIVGSRDRILKVRAIERRIAEHQVARSNSALGHVTGLANRIAMLRDVASIESGPAVGAELHASCEMTGRLDAAQRAMQAPLTSAIDACARHRETLVAARQSEKAAEQLALASSRLAAKERDIRENAARIFRTNVSVEDMLP